MKKDISPELMAVAERQIRNWELALETQERIERHQAVAQLSRQVHPYIALSREAGAGCSEIAKLVTSRLGMELLDKELLTFMAERYNLSEGMLELVDEETTNWLRDVFGHWVNQHVVPQSKFVSHLGQIALLAARSGRTMFVGRGVQFILPRERGLVVWIIAPREKRIERVMARWSLSRDKATRYVEERDQARRNFIQRYFHRDLTDPHLHDLVVNTERLTFAAAADLIAEEYQRRFRDVL